MSLKTIIEQNDSRRGRVFDLAIQALILVSLISFSIETLPDLSASTRRLLRQIEIVTVTLFTIEYCLRVIVADSKPRFVFSFFGLVDLLSILPFYITTGLDLRSLRSLRFLRLFQTMKLARYSRAVKRFHRAFLIAREELLLFLFATMLLFYLAAVGIYFFEHQAQPEVFGSIPHSLWWSVITLTTVGYGDAYPITHGGKCFTFAVLMLGLGLVAVPSGMVASALAEARKMEEDDVDLPRAEV